jgi:hypothetical protein
MSNLTIEQFVQREVIYCVSGLIHELAKEEKYMDDLLLVISQDDWETAALDEGWEKDVQGNITNPKRLFNLNVYQSWEDCCIDENIEPQQTEAYEHWIVTGWLADKLEDAGEMILRDFMGINAIWGRACTGQFIGLDSVIEKIYNELHTKAA